MSDEKVPDIHVSICVDKAKKDGYVSVGFTYKRNRRKRMSGRG